MTIRLTGTARDNNPLALTREVEQVLLRLLASREVGHPHARGDNHRRRGLLDSSRRGLCCGPDRVIDNE